MPQGGPTGGSGRNIPGVLGGSRLLEQPHIAPEVDALRGFLSVEGPVLVEVGFDHGRRLHSMARLNPRWRFVGLEVRRERVDEARERAERDGLTNLHAWRVDARTVFASVLEPASVDVVDVLFPTPWWDAAKRAKRLLVSDAFVADVTRCLRPGGLLHLATDVAGYADEVRDVLAGQATLELVTGKAAAALQPACAQQSRREWKCEREGIPVRSFFARRAPQLATPAAP